jgi:hypothetical protein
LEWCDLLRLSEHHAENGVMGWSPQPSEFKRRLTELACEPGVSVSIQLIPVFYLTVRRTLGDKLDEVTHKLRHPGDADA